MGVSFETGWKWAWKDGGEAEGQRMDASGWWREKKEKPMEVAKGG